MKVKGPGTSFGLIFGGPMGRGWGAEGRRSPAVGSVGAVGATVGVIVAGICAGEVSVGVVDVGEAR